MENCFRLGSGLRGGNSIVLGLRRNSSGMVIPRDEKRVLRDKDPWTRAEALLRMDTYPLPVFISGVSFAWPRGGTSRAFRQRSGASVMSTSRGSSFVHRKSVNSTASMEKLPRANASHLPSGDDADARCSRR